ncbi:hypothetical protein [Neobacillus mesonae]|uniref:hypothetical protein n=1 Tax=Neobacillus mesonae TaxID=1193713 RepID=UPI00203DFF58|nr:hypothetical protein [Neobacillus mesonae]MCM3571006.1 hypothetical protein [Neobacillus mesonae]
MHFRHILFSGLLTCTALFVSDHAFAAKDEINRTQHAANTTVQVEKAVKTELPAKSSDKAKDAVSIHKPLKKSKTDMEQQKKVPAISQATNANKKAVEKISSVVEKKRDKGQSDNIQANGLQKADTNTKPKGSKVQQQSPKAEKRQPAQTTKQDIRTEKAPSAENQKESNKTKHTNINKAVTTKPAKQKLEKQKLEKSKLEKQKPVKSEKAPVEQKTIPDLNQALNQSQRMNGSGSKANDRVNTSFSTINLVDKWIIWHHYFEVQLIQPYFSRLNLLRNQWVNAPPSPPPQFAPIFNHVS